MRFSQLGITSHRYTYILMLAEFEISSRVRIPFLSSFLQAVMKYFKGNIVPASPLEDCLCMPSLEKATVREEPHELGTSILGRVVDRTTLPAPAGTAIPHASLEEIAVTRPDPHDHKPSDTVSEGVRKDDKLVRTHTAQGKDMILQLLDMLHQSYTLVDHTLEEVLEEGDPFFLLSWGLSTLLIPIRNNNRLGEYLLATTTSDTGNAKDLTESQILGCEEKSTYSEDRPHVECGKPAVSLRGSIERLAKTVCTTDAQIIIRTKYRPSNANTRRQSLSLLQLGQEKHAGSTSLGERESTLCTRIMANIEEASSTSRFWDHRGDEAAEEYIHATLLPSFNQIFTLPLVLKSLKSNVGFILDAKEKFAYRVIAGFCLDTFETYLPFMRHGYSPRRVFINAWSETVREKGDVGRDKSTVAKIWCVPRGGNMRDDAQEGECFRVSLAFTAESIKWGGVAQPKHQYTSVSPWGQISIESP
ncbi:hypothetical protein Tco_0527353 [Tanacetum coccineum]